MTKKQKMIYLSKQLLESKVCSYDILYDLHIIIRERLKLFASNINIIERERAEEYLKKLSEVTDNPKYEYEFPNRLYIICGVQFVGMACVDLSDLEFRTVLEDIKISNALSCEPVLIENIEPNMIITAYLFEKAENGSQYFCEHLCPADAMRICQALSSKNIADYGLVEIIS